MDGQSHLGPEDLSATEIAQAPSSESIGHVDSVQGDAHIVRADGTTVPAEAGQQIYLGDVVETGAKGAIGLVFVDDSTFSLSDNGKMTIDELVYDPAAHKGSSLFNVAQGVFTFVSGEIAKTSVDAMQIETPVATIGIRGTAGGGRIVRPENPDLPPSATFSNFRDPITGQAGEINITTPTGTQTLNGVNSMTSVANPFVPPTPPVKIPLAALRAVFGAAVAALPKPPARAQQTQEQGQDGAPTGPGGTGGGGQNNQQGGNDVLGDGDAPAPGSADAQAAADAAAAAAFTEALAQGIDPGEALALAGAVAEQTTARFGLDTAQLDTFSTQNAIDNVLTTLTQSTTGQATGSQLGGTGGTTLSGGTTGTGEAGGGTGQTGNLGTGQLTEQQVDQLFQQFLASFLPTTTVQVTDQVTTTTNDTTTTTTVVVTDTASGDSTVLGATIGDDTLSGGTGVDEFLMYQDTSTTALGGDDTLIGGAGTDYITLLDLSDGWLRYDPTLSTEQVDYSFGAGDAFGTMTLDSVERIFAAPLGATELSFSSLASISGITLNTNGDAILLPVTSSSSLLGYIGVGTSGADQSLRLDRGFDPLDETGLATSQVGGSIIFGLEGNDSLGGGDGTDILFGGADDDILYGEGGDDFLFGGTGNDQLYVGTGSDYADGGDGDDYFYIGTRAEGSNSQTSGTLIGGDGADTLSMLGTNDFRGVTISGIESLAMSYGSSSATFLSSQIGVTAGNFEDVFVSSGYTNSVTIDMDSVTYDAGAEITFYGATSGKMTLTVNGTTGNDTITVSSAGLAQTLNGGAGDDILIDNASGTFAALRGGEGSDIYQYGANAMGSTDSVYDNGSTGTDTIRVTGGNDFSNTTISGIEVLDLNGVSNTTISVGQGSDFTTFDFSDSADETLTISIASGNTLDLSSTTILGFSGGDALVIEGSVGNDTITGSSGVDTIYDGTSYDTIIGGGGADIIHLDADSTADTIVFNAVSEFGDTISGFTAGANGDILDINVTVTRGNFMETLSSGAIGSSTGILGFSGSVGSATASSVASAVGGAITGFSAGESLLIGLSHGSDTYIWYWQDATSAGGDNDGVIDANELSLVATLTGISDYTTLTEDNLSGFTESGSGVSGTQTYTMVASTNDVIVGSSGNDTITLSGAAESGDSVDLAGGSDILILDATDNTLSIAGVENLRLASTAQIQALALTDATDITISNDGGSTADLAATINLTSSGSNDQTVTIGTGGATNFNASSFDLGAGTDTLVLAGTGEYSLQTKHLQGVETLSLTGGGSVNMTSAMAAYSGLSSISSDTALSMTTIDRDSSKSISATASDTSTYTLNSTGSTTLNDGDWANISTRAFGGGLNLNADQAYTLTVDTNFKNAFEASSAAAKIVLTTANSQNIVITASTAFNSGYGLYFDGTNGTGTQTVSTGNAADTLYLGSGDVLVSTANGNDRISLAAATFDDNDHINAGSGTDTLALTGGGTVDDSYFYYVISLEALELDDSAYTINLGTEATTTFDTGITINSLQTSHALTLNAASYFHDPITVSLTSSTAANSIITGSNNETITTGSGDDYINSGTGNDTLTGGGGRDTFVMTDDGTNGTDTITDFTAGSSGDVIAANGSLLSSLSGTAFTSALSSGGYVSSGVVVIRDDIDMTSTTTIASGLSSLSAVASENTLLLVGDATNSKLYYLANDSTAAIASGELTLVANLNGVSTSDRGDLTNANFGFGTIFSGTASSDTLSGTANTDTIFGFGGDDTISDGAGADIIYGGTGNDTIQLANDSTSDVLRYVAADLNDTDIITGSVSDGFKRGSGGDIFDLDIANTVTNGVGNEFQTLGNGGVLGAGTAVINYTENVTSYNDAATVLGELNSISGKSANDQLFMIVSNGTDSALWYWDDTSGSTGGSAEIGELHLVATIAGSYGDTPSSFTADNFQDVVPQGV